jgi:hypothetical protein
MIAKASLTALLIFAATATPSAATGSAGSTTCWACAIPGTGAPYCDIEPLINRAGCTYECSGSTCECSTWGECRVSLAPSSISPSGASRAGRVAVGKYEDAFLRSCSGIVIGRMYPKEDANDLRVRTATLEL